MLYRYVGPPDLRAHPSPTRRLVRRAHDVALWSEQTGQTRDATGEVTATFIVNARGELWIADRRSEHVACAGGGPVKAAGEMTFQVDRSEVEVVALTNQSTGFCPRPDSWQVVADVLCALGLERPDGWTTRFDFRRCESCGAVNVVKDDWLVCALCDADLPRAWNFG